MSTSTTIDQRRIRITGDQRREMATTLADRYVAGESIRTLAAAIGRSYGWVHKVISETEVAFRSRGGSHRRQPTTA